MPRHSAPRGAPAVMQTWPDGRAPTVVVPPFDDVKWRRLPGFGKYEVSSDGRVRSRPRTIIERGTGRVVRRRGVELRQAPTSHGYLCVSLYDDEGREHKRDVHALVTEAFHGPRPEGHEARHGNGNQRDNAATNLSWSTHAENQRDQIVHGTHAEARRETCDRRHPLRAPNLSTRRRKRECLACKRAHSRAVAARRRGETPDIDRLSALAYEEIVRTNGASLAPGAPRPVAS